MTDPMELVGRLEARGRIHRARASGLQKRIDAGDRSVSIQDPQNAIREAETDEKAAACIREMVECERSVDFELWQNDELVAGSDSEREILRYAAVYEQDGPVEVFKVVSFRSPLPPAPGAEA